MTDQPSRPDRWFARIKIILEIIAIPAAAYWAFTRFVEGEAPSLQERVAMQGELHWHERSENDCLVEYAVAVQNIGKTSVNVREVHLSWWLLEEPPAESEITFLDPDEITKGKSPLKMVMPTNLNGSYAPDVSDKTGFLFRVRKAPGRIIMFKLGVMTDRDLHGDYRWDYICGERPSQGGKPRISRAAKSPS